MTHSLRDRVMSPIRERRRLHYFLRNLYFAPFEWPRATLARLGCAARTLPIVMIVGCSRSGTSFTARMLKSAGLLLPGETIEPDAFNPDGYFEANRVVAINGDLLRGSGGHWFLPPPALRVHAYQRAQIVQALAWLGSFPGVCGWKDPRGTLTLQVWLEIARELNISVRVVGTFRNPAATAHSIVRHEQGLFDFGQALNAWCVYSTRLLELAESIPDRFYWFTINQTRQEMEKNLNAIAVRLGLAGRMTPDHERKSELESPALANIPDIARDIYRRLIDAHALQWKDTIVPAEVCDQARFNW